MQPVRGVKDFLPEEFEKILFVINSARKIFSLYGFREIDIPMFESTELFSRSLGDGSDIVHKEMYTFDDKSGNSLTLRPEFTAGVARAVVNAGSKIKIPAYLFACGPVFRYERPQKGRQRQFMQINCEAIGSNNPCVDAEMISMSVDFLKNVGVYDKVTLNINSIADIETRRIYSKALYDYLYDNFDYLSEDSKRRLDKNILRILDSKDPSDKVILNNAPSIDKFFTKDAGIFFEKVCKNLDLLGVNYSINKFLVRGLDYYCHTVFEFITDMLGAQGTLIGGGRYNGLYSIISNMDMPAIGFAGGVERIVELIDFNLFMNQDLCIVGVIVIGEFVNYGYRISCELRLNGVKAIIIHDGSDVGKKIKKAHNNGVNYVIIAGEEEVKSNTVLLKDLTIGNQYSFVFDSFVSEVKKIIGSRE